MRHQPEDVALSAAYSCDAASGAVGIVGVGNLFYTGKICSGRLTVPPGLRVRLLFTAAEELGYLGARAYVRDIPLGSIAGVLSLELCGIGDSLAVWDADTETDFLRRVTGTLGGLGLRRDEGYHVVGRIPVFGSDHRAFAAAGIPAYGLSVVPFAEAEGLRRFVLSPVRSTLMHAVRRPPPFDTYHTSRDASSTLDPRALDLRRQLLHGAGSLSQDVEDLRPSTAGQRLGDGSESVEQLALRRPVTHERRLGRQRPKSQVII